MGFTYDTLSSAIVNYIENDGEEFQNMVPNIIENSVRTIAREVDIVGLKAITTIAGTSGSPLVPLPSECLVIHTIARISSGVKKELLNRRSYDFITTYWPESTSVGTPIYYDRIDDNNIYVGPTPSEDSSFEVRYTTVSIPTSISQDSYLLTNYPDLVLYRCMVEANLIIKDMSDVQVWSSLYDRTREGVENEARRNRRDDTNSPIMSPLGSNNLKQGTN